MDIIKILKEYKSKKAIVESAEARIEAWNNALMHPEMWEKDYIPPSQPLGMPFPATRNIQSPVEKIVEHKEVTTEMIKEWIKEEESRIFFLKLEVKQIEIALNGLTQWERYIIECRYFDGLTWRNTEINFNEKFKQRNDLTEERIRQINREALKKLEMIFQTNLALKFTE